MDLPSRRSGLGHSSPWTPLPPLPMPASQLTGPASRPSCLAPKRAQASDHPYSRRRSVQRDPGTVYGWLRNTYTLEDRPQGLQQEAPWSSLSFAEGPSRPNGQAASALIRTPLLKLDLCMQPSQHWLWAEHTWIILRPFCL